MLDSTRLRITGADGTIVRDLLSELMQSGGGKPSLAMPTQNAFSATACKRINTGLINWPRVCGRSWTACPAALSQSSLFGAGGIG